MSDKLNENCSVDRYRQAEFKVESVVRGCLVPFPYIWASVDNILIDSTCLIMLSLTHLIGSEC